MLKEDSYVLIETNKNSFVHVDITFYGYVGTSCNYNKVPTFAEIRNNPVVNEIIYKYAKDEIEKAWSNVTVKVQSEKEGLQYDCDFTNSTFVLKHEIPSLAEERIRRKEVEEEYNQREAILKMKQRGKFVAIAIMTLVTILLCLLDAEKGRIFLPITAFADIIIAFWILSAEIRFENSGGFYL